MLENELQVISLKDQQPAHVKSVHDGLLEVDQFRDFQTPEEVIDYVTASRIIGTGTEAVCFIHPEAEDIVIRIEPKNVMGKHLTQRMFDALIARDSGLYREDLITLRKVAGETVYGEIDSAYKQVEYLEERIAATNAQFRRDPMSTVPINSYITYKEQLLGVRMKFLDGLTLSKASPNAQVTYEDRKVLKDHNKENVIVEIKNSVSPIQLIDIHRFRPSNS